MRENARNRRIRGSEESMTYEHDNCGIGAIVNINGSKDHAVVDDALKIVEN